MSNQSAGRHEAGELENCLSELLSASLAPSTQSSYRRSWSVYRNFASMVLRSPVTLPIALSDLMLFIAHLHRQGAAPSSISSTLSALSFVHKIKMLDDPTKAYVISKLIAGAKVLTPSSDVRLPITRNILIRIIGALDMVTSTDYSRLLYTAMLTLAFAAFLRIGEIAPKNHFSSRNCLAFRDVVMSEDGVLLSFRHFKSSGSMGSQAVRIQRQPVCCAVAALRRYCAVRPAGEGLLFVEPSGQPVVRDKFDRMLKSALAFCGLDSAKFKGHSLRIGAASQAALDGKSDAFIRAAGRWSSDAFKRYIRFS